MKEFFIVIKHHLNPTSNVGENKTLPVLMLDKDGEPLEFESKQEAKDFVEILNLNSNQNFRYEVKQIGRKVIRMQRVSED